WYLRIAIDKNFENILKKAKEERTFVEQLLFTENKIPFVIDQSSIKLLHTNGLIKDEGDGFVTFWVPFYKKRLYNAFYPYTNGEKTGILRSSPRRTVRCKRKTRVGQPHRRLQGLRKA